MTEVPPVHSRLRPVLFGALGILLLLALLGTWGPLVGEAAAAPEISVTKLAGNGDGAADEVEIGAGDDAVFTISVTNNGTGPADITINDPLPGGAELNWNIWWWAPDDGLDPVECTIAGEGAAQTLSCQFDDLDAGDTATVVVGARSGIGRCSTWRNVATVTATDQTGITEVTDDATVICNGPTVSMTKTPGKETVLAGEDITFTITFTNQGPGTIENWRSLSLEDQLPGGTAGPWEIVDGPKDGEGYDLCEVYENEGQYELDCYPLGELDPGDSFTVTVKAPTNTRLCSTYHNTASIFEGGHGDGRSELPAATAEATVTCRQPVPGLAVTKTAAKANVNAGEDVAFTIETASTGDLTAEGVKLTDPLPGGTAGNWTLTDQPSGNPCSITGGTVTCSFGGLAPGQSRNVTVTAPTSADQCGTYENTATASAEGVPGVSATATVTCVKPTPPPPPPPPPTPKPKLQLRVEANRSVVRPGQRVRWTVSVRNRRKGSVAKNLTVCDRIAPRMTVVNRGGGRIGKGRICWPIKRLKGATGWTRFHYTTRVNLDARHGERPRDQASLGNLRAHAQVKVKVPPKPKPPRRTPVTG